MLVTCYAHPRPGVTAQVVADCLAEAYGKTSFVRPVPAEAVAVHEVAGTNLAWVGATCDADVVVAVCAIDNLVKGAAGQAVQNLNLLYGLGESAGLLSLQRFAP